MSRLGRKILIMIISIALVAIVILGTTYIVMFTQVNKTTKNECLESVNNAIKALNGDKLEAVIKANSMDSKEFLEIKEDLIKFKNGEDIRYAYTLILKDNEIYFLVDADLKEPAALGDKYEVKESVKDCIRVAFNGEISVSKKYSDKWGTFISGYAPIKDSSGKIIAIVAVDKNVETIYSIMDVLIISLILAAIIFIVLSFVITFIYSKKLTNNIKCIQSSLSRMENGDFTNELSVCTKDEIEDIAVSIEKVRKRVNGVISIFKEEAANTMTQAHILSNLSQRMAFTSKNVTSSIEDIAKGSDSQATDLISISQAIEEFGKQINNIVNYIEDADSNAKDIDLMAKESDKMLQTLVFSINDIGKAFTNVASKINGLSTSIGTINEITDAIKGIADQTNLLALNASIEAARAGEAGKGFAVVAEEIRKLAEQSKKSSDSIESLLGSISKDTDVVVRTTYGVNEELNNQVNTIEVSIQSFKKIVTAIENIIPKMHNINKSALLVNEESVKISDKITMFSAIAQETAAATEEITASSQEMYAASEEVEKTSSELGELTEKVNDEISVYKL